MFVVVGLFLKRSVFELFSPWQGSKSVISVILATSMRADEELAACQSRSCGRDMVDLLLFHLVVAMKMLDEMISPAKSLLASVASAEGARVLRTVLGKALEVTNEYFTSSKLDSARTCKSAMLRDFHMGYKFVKGNISPVIVTINQCSREYLVALSTGNG
jgi:hypothetical protein